MTSLKRRVWLAAFAALALCIVAGAGLSAAAPDDVHGVVETIGSSPDAITVLYTWGTPYEMGHAQGRLLREGVEHMHKVSLSRFLLGGIGPKQQDEAWKQAEPFIPADDLEEMRGLSDGTDGAVPLQTVQRMHITPEVSEWHCSFFAAWGDATTDGHLIQIRALDYATEAGIQKYPLITVAYPQGGQPYVNVGWQGFTGLVTGYNSSQVAMSEIGDDWDKDNDTFAGIPMVFLMKSVMRQATSLTEAVDQVSRAPRTTSYLYCLGDAKVPDARALQTGHSECRAYSPDEIPAGEVPSTVYMSMGIDSPWNAKFHDRLTRLRGHIDPAHAMNDLMKGLKTGSLHSVCMDATAGKLWVANAEGDLGSVVPGYDRPFVEFDAAAAFAKVKALAGR
jgi:hypothetical protein